MPSLIKITKTIYRDAAGRRCDKAAPGARKFNVKTRKWYGRGVPGFPPKKGFPLSADRRVAEAMLAKMVSDAERGIHDLPERNGGAKQLAALLPEFGEDMAVGLGSKVRGKSRLPSPEQVDLNLQRVRTMLDACKFVTCSNLNAAAPKALARWLLERVSLPRKDGGFSHQSADFYRKAAKRFVWWLSVRKRLPVRADLFDDVVGFDPKANRVHLRRVGTPAELAALLLAARNSKEEWRGLSGADRYHVYLLGFSTGFRASELARLSKCHLAIDDRPPVVVLPGDPRKKNRKLVRQPIPPNVAQQFREYLAGKEDGPLWPGTWRFQPVKMLRADLRAAGVAYKVQTAEGVKCLDFHALRHTFVSCLAAAKIGVKELQLLARHSDPTLTLAVYTHVGEGQLAESVGKLPLIGDGGAGDELRTLSREELENNLRLCVEIIKTLTGQGVPEGVPRPLNAMNTCQKS